VDPEGVPGFIGEVLEASSLVAAQPVVECSSRYLGCGADPAEVLEVRQRKGCCSEAIEAYLKSHGVQVSHGSIHRIMKYNHLPMRTYAPRKQRTYIRFQRAHPDSLWQTHITNYANQHLIAFIDDCSRYVPSASLCLEATTDNVLETLQEALSNGRTPKQILSDHGTQYWSNDGPGRFTNFCEAA
jgi:transposase InsO family protein